MADSPPRICLLSLQKSKDRTKENLIRVLKNRRRKWTEYLFVTNSTSKKTKRLWKKKNWSVPTKFLSRPLRRQMLESSGATYNSAHSLWALWEPFLIHKTVLEFHRGKRIPLKRKQPIAAKHSSNVFKKKKKCRRSLCVVIQRTRDRKVSRRQVSIFFSQS